MRWRLAALKNGFLDAAAYRLEFVIEILAAAFVPAAIQWVLWYAIFKIGNVKTIAGLTHHDLLLYTWVSLLYSQIRGGDHDFELSEMIRSGSLSNYLLRPVGAVEFVYIRGVAPKIFTSALCLILGFIMSFFIELSPIKIILGMLMAWLGNIIHYQISASLASAAFYWEEAYSVLMVKNMIVGLLSGELIPLSLFPENLQWIWKTTPFYLYVFGPTQIALGKWSTQEILFQFGIALCWMIGATLLVRGTWGLGIKRYLSLGG